MGETETKESFDMENYKYRNNPIMHSVSLTNNDAAYVLLGKHWKMPTKKEMQELLDKCTWTWKEVKGIKGYIVKSKVNGNSIFLPGMMGKYETIGKFENGCWGLWFSNSIRTSKSFFIPAVSNNDINMCRNGDNISLFSIMQDIGQEVTEICVLSLSCIYRYLLKVVRIQNLFLIISSHLGMQDYIFVQYMSIEV